MAKYIRNGAAHGSTVKACSCKSDYQDRVYGRGMRLHTVTNKGSRCTVCGKEKMV